MCRICAVRTRILSSPLALFIDPLIFEDLNQLCAATFQMTKLLKEAALTQEQLERFVEADAVIDQEAEYDLDNFERVEVHKPRADPPRT